MTLRARQGFFLLVLVVLSVSLSGCANIRKKTKKEVIKTGMFADDREELAKRFGQIVRGKTSKQNLESLGFDLTAKNIQVISGVPAFRELFGQEAFRNLIGNEFDRNLPEYNRYTLYQIPFRETLVTSDRIYLNKKMTTTVGWDTVYSIVTHDDMVVYAAPRIIFLNQSQKDIAFLSGLIEILRELSGAIGIIR